MRRQAPPFEAIEAFLIASRAENFRRAAEALKISPSALSRRIQTLETFLGRRLLVRDGRSPRLSMAGRRYIGDIEPAIEAIRDASDRVRGEPGEVPVRLAAPHSFAQEWLTPRLGGFRRAHPDVEVELQVGHGAEALHQGGDLAIVADGSDLAGVPSMVLFEAVAVVAASPELLALHGPVLTPADLQRHRLLAVEHPADLWARWAAAVGTPPPHPAERLPTQALLLEAAAAGLGVALGVSPLIDRFLADGRLQCCLAPAKLDACYRLAWRHQAAGRRPEVAIVASWLAAEAATSRAAFLATLPSPPRPA